MLSISMTSLEIQCGDCNRSHHHNYLDNNDGLTGLSKWWLNHDNDCCIHKIWRRWKACDLEILREKILENCNVYVKCTKWNIKGLII